MCRYVTLDAIDNHTGKSNIEVGEKKNLHGQYNSH